jgi:hypothetical protein
MAEIAAARIIMLVPIIGELDERRAGLFRLREIVWRGEIDEGEAALLILGAAHLGEAELAAEEIQRAVEIADADHRMEKLHIGASCGGERRRA